MNLPAILEQLEQCKYRLEEARDEHDLRDRIHHNAGVEAAKAVIVADAKRSGHCGPRLTVIDLSLKAELTGGDS